jgi:hypothetical protein
VLPVTEPHQAETLKRKFEEVGLAGSAHAEVGHVLAREEGGAKRRVGPSGLAICVLKLLAFRTYVRTV